MEFADIVRKRRMVRNFTSEPIPAETVERMLTLAQLAPSAGFTQGQSFIIVTRPDLRQEIARICIADVYVENGWHSFISGAPLLAIPCVSETAYHHRYQEADKMEDDGSEIEWPIPYWFMDGGCSVMLLLLAVVNEGLAAGFAGIPGPNFVAFRRLLQLPDEVMPLGVIPIGHAAPDTPSPFLKRGRKSPSEFIHRESW